MSVEYRIGDVFERLAEIPDGSIDLVVTSPPFLALRSYLPTDHPDKHKEIGSEPTPAEFIDTLLALSAEWGRVLAPHGSICVELGDTFSASGGSGGDYNAGGMRNGQSKVDGSARRTRTNNLYNTDNRYSDDWNVGNTAGKAIEGVPMNGGNGWPLAKSLTGIPTLYPWSLAYGRNLLTGEPSPAGQWRIRNVIVWARPNPPVGALGDKWRPATSYITVACKGPKRYFDLDAVRTALLHPGKSATTARGTDETHRHLGPYDASASAGAPPLDWHADDHPEDGDWLWKLSTQPYAGSHYAAFPFALPRRLILAMCPQRVCVTCGKPSTRIVETDSDYAKHLGSSWADRSEGRSKAATTDRNPHSVQPTGGRITSAQNVTTGWTDCGCSDDGTHWRTGVVLDPFAGSGTSLEAAQAVGRSAIGIDLDSRNADLARNRVGMFLEVVA